MYAKNYCSRSGTAGTLRAFAPPLCQARISLAKASPTVRPF